MPKKIKIGLIGCGNMGSAILKAVFRKYSVKVCENDKNRAKILKKKFDIPPETLSEVVSKSDVIILAVKPQDFEGVLANIKNYLRKDKVVISIAAGITIYYMQKRLGNDIKIIRTMPNLPAQINQGITAISKSKNVSSRDLNTAVKIFENIGRVLVVDENRINSITAVSGSGPAYVFLFVELFVNAAMSLGFSLEQSVKLVSQTIHGSLELLQKSKECPKDLREKVTSKGGTTQAAMDVFFKHNIDKVFIQALKAAENRARELSK